MPSAVIILKRLCAALLGLEAGPALALAPQPIFSSQAKTGRFDVLPHPAGNSRQHEGEDRFTPPDDWGFDGESSDPFFCFAFLTPPAASTQMFDAPFGMLPPFSHWQKRQPVANPFLVTWVLSPCLMTVVTMARTLKTTSQKDTSRQPPADQKANRWKSHLCCTWAFSPSSLLHVVILSLAVNCA